MAFYKTREQEHHIKKQIKESQTQTHKGKGVTVVLDRMENEI